MKDNRKINTLLLHMGIVLGLVCAGQVVLGADKNIEISYDYSGNATEYRLYMDGVKICNSAPSTEKKILCNNVPIAYGVHMFTLTAIEDGIETPHSLPYAWTYSPLNSNPPTFINFTITVDGKSQPIGPIEIK